MSASHPSLWFFCALGAAIMWGAGYVVTEILLKKYGLTPAFIMFASQLITLPIWFLICAYLGQVSPGFKLMASVPSAAGLVFLQAVLIIGGAFLIIHSISMKNATLASLIEISYPLFTALFAYLILKDTQVNLWTAAGGLLIISGISLIYLKS
jgi:drug/metabolite transporter (DMT)-like permease